MLASNAFDPETLIILRDAVDRAVATLPPDRRTMHVKNRMAEAIVWSATLGERDVRRLCDYAVSVADGGGRDAALRS
jgi:hypothetical protein